jgi:hypothetical protein
MPYLHPPYFRAQTFADGIKMMAPTTWPVVLGFAMSTTLLLYVHSKLAKSPAIRAKSCMSSSSLIISFVFIYGLSVYLAQLEGRDPHGHHDGHPAPGAPAAHASAHH